MARSNPPLKSAFVAEFARRLQGQGPAMAMPLTWIEQRLSECSLTIERLVQSENQQQAADQVSMSNSIGSLRLLGTMDWREFVETLSVVEQALRADPAAPTAAWTSPPATAIATRWRASPSAVGSRKARWRPRRSGSRASTRRDGRRSRKRQSRGARGLLPDRPGPAAARSAGAGAAVAPRAAPESGFPVPVLLYLGAIALLTAICAGGLLAQAHGAGAPPWLLAGTGILSVLCASQLAVGR